MAGKSPTKKRPSRIGSARRFRNPMSVTAANVRTPLMRLRGPGGGRPASSSE